MAVPKINLRLVLVASVLLVCVVLINVASKDGFPTVAVDGTAPPVELLQNLQDAERADGQFAGCVNQLKGEGMQLVMTVDKECGDVFTASQCSVSCHGAAEAIAATMGCCWQPLISGFSRVQPSAAHAWHAWTFNLENLCGISLTAQCAAAGYSAQKDVADQALSVAERALKRAQDEERSAKAARRLAIKAQKRAKKLQREMKKESLQFKKLRKRFRLARADAARTIIVERMVHNSVKKDLSSAWGLHQQVSHDRALANKMAAGTQIEQANARNLLKSAHAAKKSVYKMAKMASKAKHAAYRLHKLSLKDLARAREIEKQAKLQRKIAEKAGKDVEKQLKLSEKIIHSSKKQQEKAKQVWLDLQKEQSDFDAEKKDADDDEKSEEDLDKEIADDVDDADAKFDEFAKTADTVQDAVEQAETVAERADSIVKQASDLMDQTDAQQDRIDREKGWITQQEGEMMAGRKGIAAIEGELEVLKRKYFDLRKAISGLEYEAPQSTVVTAPVANQQYERHAYANTPFGNYETHEFQNQYVYPGMPLHQVVVPLPPSHRSTYEYQPRPDTDDIYHEYNEYYQ